MMASDNRTSSRTRVPAVTQVQRLQLTHDLRSPADEVAHNVRPQMRPGGADDRQERYPAVWA